MPNASEAPSRTEQLLAQIASAVAGGSVKDPVEVQQEAYRAYLNSLNQNFLAQARQMRVAIYLAVREKQVYPPIAGELVKELLEIGKNLEEVFKP